MAANGNRNTNSMETILTFENRNVSQWSMVWSTAHIPGMDTAAGGGGTRHVGGRQRLRIGTFILGALLTMHCRVTASALTGGFFIFLASLVMAVVLLANPLRHFEIYLGQWSISGPGRAFRIIPMFDGIGIAICINAIVRAICCCSMAAITAVYIWHSISDARLPFTYCRDFDLNAYEPIMKDLKLVRRRQFSLFRGKNDEIKTTVRPSTVGLYYRAWRNISLISNDGRMNRVGKPRQIQVCKETYTGKYPPLFNTPAYNFFYVEVMRLREDLSLVHFNVPLLISNIIAWVIIWLVMIGERITHGRLVWNHVIKWFAVIPCLWAALLVVPAATNINAVQRILRKAFRLDTMEIVAAMSDAFQVAMYIHSASTGTELIHGKGLNHYSSGHIDPMLNSENVWHSGWILLLAVLNSGSAGVCALVDYTQVALQEAHMMHESTLWIIPMYSKCTSSGSYSHFVTSLTFGGLTFSYMVVAYLLLKTALHTIFEYHVRLVFIEQVIVGILLLICMASSLFFSTHGGVALLESVDSIMTGLAMPLICMLELVGMLYVYRSRDFVSDMNIATEDNACGSRIGTQWQTIPFITLIAFGMKLSVLLNTELPQKSLLIAFAPLLAVLASVPIRGCYNAYHFLRGVD